MTIQQTLAKLGTVLFRGGLACFVVLAIAWFVAIIHDATASGEGTMSMAAVALAFLLGPLGILAVVLGNALRKRAPKGCSDESVDQE